MNPVVPALGNYQYSVDNLYPRFDKMSHGDLILGDFQDNHRNSKRQERFSGYFSPSRQGRALIDVTVRSGDYFITLATKLDLAADQCSDTQTAEILQGLVNELAYLQSHYKISKR